jgi:hypothetical protein
MTTMMMMMMMMMPFECFSDAMMMVAGGSEVAGGA